MQESRVHCTSDESAKLPRKSIPNKNWRGWRRREEESKSTSSSLLFDIGEVFSSNRPNPRDRV